MSEENQQKPTQKPGPKWTQDHFYDSYQEATVRVVELNKLWTEKDQQYMQTKIRRRSNGRFLVKFRKDPVFTEQEKKNGNNSRKNKRNSKAGKFDAQTSV